ncbi:MAG: SDR family NAD(P)-dependent oxidoreductase, partial [Limisphaerales bacterium]
MFSLSGRIALVTGAGSGIGAAIAHVFATAGAHVIVTDVEEKRGNDTVSHIINSGGRAEFLPIDVSSDSSAQKTADQ